MTISNLTYAERARFADNVELRDALETCAEQEAIIERLDSLCEDMLYVLYEVLLILWMRYPGAANALRDSIDQLENILTSPRDEGGT